MGLFSMEHSKAAYRADFALYGLAVLGLSLLLVVDGPSGMALPLMGCALLGLAGWTLIEYALHRFVLHGLQPFRRWHAEHHARPTALICAPTLLSAGLILVLVFLPALLLGTRWHALALTLGVLAGYLAYAVTHHATHHWRARHAWLHGRKRWHALHHHDGHGRCYGVTSGFWDRLLGSAAVPPRRGAPAAGAGAARPIAVRSRPWRRTG